MSDEKIKLTESGPKAHKADYENLCDMPNDVAAGRLVGSLILAKGNLVKIKEIITYFLDNLDQDRKKKEQDRPTVVCLCGSTRFIDTFHKAEFEETLTGRIVLTIGCDAKSEGELFKGPKGDAIKVMLDELHKRKIDLADEVLILNVYGYIGSSTKSELEYAQKHGKKIRYLVQLDPAKTYYVVRNSGNAVFVKTGEFFESQGGLKESWGREWKKIQAESIEDAREIGKKILPKES